MQTKIINRIRALFLVATLLLSVMIVSLNVRATDATASLSANQITTGQSVTLTLNISGTNFASAGISVAGVENVDLVSGPHSNVHQVGNTFNITTDLANDSSTAHTYVLNISYSTPGTKTINISYDLISSDLNRTVLNRLFTITVLSPATAAPTPTPQPTPTPRQTTTRQATINTSAPAPMPTQTTARPSRTSSQDTNGTNYRSLNKKMVVTSDLDIRSDASLSSTYLGSYDRGTVVDVIGITDNGWYVINYNGQTAYLAGSYLDDYNAPDSDKNESENNNDNENANTEETTTSESTNDSRANSASDDERTSPSTKTLNTTDGDNELGILGTTDSASTPEIKNDNIKSVLQLDVTMLIIIGLFILLIILLIVYYLLKKRILDDEDEEEFEELPGDNNEAIYSNKSSNIEISRVNDSEKPKNHNQD